MVNENKGRMQDMWELVCKESAELRDWAARGLSDLRTTMRGKMDEREAQLLVESIRKDVVNLAPSLSEAMSRLEIDVRHKADFSSVARLEDITEELQNVR